jgi:hypothetical protein
MGDKCMKDGWNDKCCCNCQNQRVILKHPWNKDDKKGHTTDVVGFGCAAPGHTHDGTSAVIFKDVRHGMCEMYEDWVVNK